MTGAARLFYLMGPSGAGKDSLIGYARQRLALERKIIFSHRYITRPPELTGENHVYLPEDEFKGRLQHGFFAMHWTSHGFHYGIGREIEFWNREGFSVVVNGSRDYWPTAQQRYPDLTPVWVTVSPEQLLKRLEQRGRETSQEIQQRLKRAAAYQTIDHPNLLRLDNSGPLASAGELFIALLTQKIDGT
ncbi:MAG: phosphonate metabolism protein/1,5-bisphosphokinase (PRPP-forming) PhnN [Methylococcales bacterium]|nr:phosphonate metabolism protein/1,5-bisphosphokinase (PRPP-forming) PhnN [Methylococcales bacterium]